MTELDLNGGRMISEAKTISQIHDYISILMSGLEVHPENAIMLMQHEHWTATVLSVVTLFRRCPDAVQDHMERSGEIYESSPTKDAELHRRDSDVQ